VTPTHSEKDDCKHFPHKKTTKGTHSDATIHLKNN